MLAREKKSFIDLGKKPAAETALPSEPKAKEPKPYYPSLYLDKDVGFTEADLGEEIIAVVKLTPKRISKMMENGKETYSCEVEIKGIKIGV